METKNTDTTVLSDNATVSIKQHEPQFRSSEEQEAYVKAVQKCGDMFEGKRVNPICAAAFIAEMFNNKLIFEPDKGLFYRYVPDRSLWVEIDDPEDFKVEILNYLHDFCYNVLRIQDIGCHIGTSKAGEIIKHLKRLLRKEDFFERGDDEFVLHVKNGFLIFNRDKKKFIFHSFTDEEVVGLRSRNQLNVEYNKDAKCPRFMEQLLKPQLSEGNINILLTYLGMCFLGRNISQKIMMINGHAGGGKSTLVNIIEILIGRDNVVEFRTCCGTGQFEITRYVGKTTLCAKDAPADLLKTKFSSRLKALTGGDRLDTESKHSDDVSHVDGVFCVILTSNCTQLVKLESDRDAWARRLLVLSFNGKKPEKLVPNFDRILAEEEGPGILNAILPHLEKLLANNGKFPDSDEQQIAITKLLDESESAKSFAQECVAIGDPGDNFSMEEAYLAYIDFCRKREWQPMPEKSFSTELVKNMLCAFWKTQSHDIKRNGNKTVRGYRGVRIKGLQVQTGTLGQ